MAVKALGKDLAVEENEDFVEIDYGPDENKTEAEVINRLGRHYLEKRGRICPCFRNRILSIKAKRCWPGGMKRLWFPTAGWFLPAKLLPLGKNLPIRSRKNIKGRMSCWFQATA